MIQFQALRFVIGLIKSCPKNINLAETGEMALVDRFEFLCRNYATRVQARPNHSLIPILTRINVKLGNSRQINKKLKPPLSDSIEIKKVAHFIQSVSGPICLHFPIETATFAPTVKFDESLIIKNSPHPEECFNNLFPVDPIMDCYYTDGSKLNRNSKGAGYAVIGTARDVSVKNNITEKASIFTCEALAILQALEMIKASDGRQSRVFSDSRSVLTSAAYVEKGYGHRFLS